MSCLMISARNKTPQNPRRNGRTFLRRLLSFWDKDAEDKAYSFVERYWLLLSTGIAVVIVLIKELTLLRGS